MTGGVRGGGSYLPQCAARAWASTPDPADAGRHFQRSSGTVRQVVAGNAYAALLIYGVESLREDFCDRAAGSVGSVSKTLIGVLPTSVRSSAGSAGRLP